MVGVYDMNKVHPLASIPFGFGSRVIGSSKNLSERFPVPSNCYKLATPFANTWSIEKRSRRGFHNNWQILQSDWSTTIVACTN